MTLARTINNILLFSALLQTLLDYLHFVWVVSELLQRTVIPEQMEEYVLTPTKIGAIVPR
jgi:hypothetical protein